MTDIIRVHSEIEDAVLVFPNEASLEIFMESGARTFTAIEKPATKTSKLSKTAIIME